MCILWVFSFYTSSGVHLMRTEAKRFMHSRPSSFFNCHQSHSHLGKNGDTAGRRTGEGTLSRQRERSWKDEWEKERTESVMLLLAIILLTSMSPFFSCLCLWALLIRSQLHSEPQSGGEESRRLHLSFIQSLFLSSSLASLFLSLS